MNLIVLFLHISSKEQALKKKVENAENFIVLFGGCKTFFSSRSG